jgi:hypothetical protein
MIHAGKSWFSVEYQRKLEKAVYKNGLQRGIKITLGPYVTTKLQSWRNSSRNSYYKR